MTSQAQARNSFILVMNEQHARRSVILCLFLLGVGLWPGIAFSTENRRPVQIGALTDSWGPTPGVVGLRDGLVEMGYEENKDFFLGIRFTRGDVKALPAAARELIRYGADILFTSNPISTKAARQATAKVPIVFSGAGDPVGLGFIQSFSHPGGNLTGVTDLDLALDRKRLEILREMLPGLERVLFPYDPSEAFAASQARSYREAALRLKITLLDTPLRSRMEARAALSNIEKNEVQSIVAPYSLSANIPGFILEATTRERVPSMFNFPWYVENGGLVSYGADLYESGRMAARLVAKIINGKNPADVPVEVNQKKQLAINLKVARALGLEISPHILYRADRVMR